MIVDALIPRATSPAPDDDFWYSPALSDSDVTPDTAIEVVAVLACVRLRAKTIGHLPLHLMATEGRMRRQAREHPLYDVLANEPNTWQTSLEFREMMEAHACLRGNAYAQIRPGSRGAVDQLIPLHPDRMEVYRRAVGKLSYLYRDQYGQPYRLAQDEVFHLRGLSFNGYTGVSPITANRYAVELGQKMQQHGIKFYRNAGRPSGVVTLPEGVWLGDEEHHKRMKKSWREAHTGDDLFTVAILEGGADWKAMGLSNEDAQWLESRRFQTNEIARMFDVPPHMIGSAIEHGHTYANVEQSDLAFVKHTMLSPIRRWESTINRDLVTDRKRYYAKFSLEGLLRADSETRAKFYEKMFRLGFYCRNEVRELEDLNPVPGGDIYYIPANLIPVGQEASRGDVKKIPAEQSALPLASPSFLRDWIAYAVEGFVGAEIRELEKRAGKAAEDRERFDRWAAEFWAESQRGYAERMLAPILAACGSQIDSKALAAHVCLTAINDLEANDPNVVLARWRKGRVTELADLLYEELNNGSEPKP